MAFVPELDDDVKDASTEDTSDISNQSTSTNIASAPAPSGQAASGGQATASAPSSSGNFQDFSKFKNANQGKLQALSNLATTSAQGGVDKAKSAFDSAGSAFQGEIQKNAKNFDTSAYKNLNKDSTIDADALGKDLSEAGTKVDSGIQQGQLAGTNEYGALTNKVSQVQNFGTRAGTAAVLGDAQSNQASSAAANQDALLLQSMGDFRNKANSVAQANKGVDANALAANQKALASTADKVNINNADYRKQALDKLKTARGDIDADFTAKAKAAEDSRVAGNDKTLNDASTSSMADIRKYINERASDVYKMAVPLPPKKPTGPVDYASHKAEYDAAEAKYKADTEAYQKNKVEMAQLADVDDQGALSRLGLKEDYNSAINQFKNDSAATGINANTLYRDDIAAQSRISALDKLLNSGGADTQGYHQYNSGALDPIKSNALSGMDSLVARIKAAIDSRVTAPKALTDQQYVDQAANSIPMESMPDWFKNLANAPAVATPAPAPTPAPIVASASKPTTKPTISKSITTR